MIGQAAIQQFETMNMSELQWFVVEAACALPDLAPAEYVRVFQDLEPRRKST